jgi:spore germination protein YaaH
VPFFGAPCSDAAGSELGWINVQEMLADASVLRTNVTEDALLVSPWFNFQAQDGSIHQLWFDDVSSLRPKFQLAAQYNLRGVGVWNFDCLYSATASPAQRAAAQAMWEAMQVF